MRSKSNSQGEKKSYLQKCNKTRILVLSRAIKFMYNHAKINSFVFMKERVL